MGIVDLEPFSVTEACKLKHVIIMKSIAVGLCINKKMYLAVCFFQKNI